MAELKAQKTADPLAALPSAKEVMEQIALKEAEKASAAMRELSAAEAEKKELIEKFSKASGVSDEERLARAAAIIKRAANNGLTEVEVVRFPNENVPIADEPSISANRAGKKPLPATRRSSTIFGESILKLAGTRLDFKSSTSPEGDLAILESR